MLTNKQDLKLIEGGKLSFSVQDDTLLFIHSGFISSQWHIDEIGVRVMHQQANISVGISHKHSSTHQSWFLDVSEFDNAVAYFMSLGFPVHCPDPLNYAKGMGGN
jgi:hypothetical protein